MSYLLIGLGNPGKKFESTRHNAGKMLARWLKAEGRGPKDEGRRMPEGFEIVETECFMNLSGNFVRKIVQNTRNTVQKTQNTQMAGESDHRRVGGPDPIFRFSDSPRISGFQSLLSFPELIVAHDDLDLRLGSYKIQFGKGPRLHKGILSVEQALGTKEFWRIRIGIENRLTGQQADRLTGYQVNRLKNAGSGEDYVLEKFKPEENKVLESVFPEIRKKLLENVIV